MLHGGVATCRALLIDKSGEGQTEGERKRERREKEKERERERKNSSSSTELSSKSIKNLSMLTEMRCHTTYILIYHTYTSPIFIHTYISYISYYIDRGSWINYPKTLVVYKAKMSAMPTLYRFRALFLEYY